jgi:hypothetical protein
MEKTKTLKGQILTFEDLSKLSIKELVTTYNEIIKEVVDLRPIRHFRDHQTAVNRVWNILPEYEETIKVMVEVTKFEESPKKEVSKKLRIRRFTLKPIEKVRVLKEKRTLRFRCAELLKNGATFEDVKNLVKEFNEERNKPASEIKVERRAYELIRIMHYYLNYGIKHDIETGFIQLYEKQ